MKTDYQEMEVGGEDNIQENPGMTLNYNPSRKKHNLLGNISDNISNISSLMKSRIKVDISPKEFIKQFKWIIIYMISMLILIIIFMRYHIIIGLINLCLGILGFLFLIHGIFKRMMGTYRMGTAFWILELLVIVIEIIIYILITFGQIFSGQVNFILGLLKFIGVTVVLVLFLLICAFFTYQIMRKKNNLANNYISNSNSNMNKTQKGINFATPIQTPGTISLENK